MDKLESVDLVWLGSSCGFFYSIIFRGSHASKMWCDSLLTRSLSMPSFVASLRHWLSREAKLPVFVKSRSITSLTEKHWEQGGDQRQHKHHSSVLLSQPL